MSAETDRALEMVADGASTRFGNGNGNMTDATRALKALVIIGVEIAKCLEFIADSLRSGVGR